MCKTSELAPVIEELRNAAAALCSATENLSTLFADQAEQSAPSAQSNQKTETSLTLEAVRAVLADKSSAHCSGASVGKLRVRPPLEEAV